MSNGHTGEAAEGQAGGVRRFSLASHQEYVREHLSPILESMVTALLLKKPPEPVPFIIQWLSEQAPSSDVDLEALKAKIEEAKSKCDALEKSAGGAAPELAKDSDEDSDEDDEEDELGEMEMQRTMDLRPKGPRQSVSAEAYGQWNKKQENFQAPVNPKTPAEKEELERVLGQSFMFKQLPRGALTTVIMAMKLHETKAGDKVIGQGDDGDCLYMVAKGTLECFKKFASGEEKKVKEYGTAEAFGELALLYNCPRAATVISKDDARLWTLDRDTFNYIVKDAMQARTERVTAFIAKCPTLTCLDSYAQWKLSEALRYETHAAGDTIIRQGEAGDDMYFIETGKCVARKVFVEGTPPKDVHTHNEGDYFGELALIRNAERHATVCAVTDVTVLALPRAIFTNLFGPLADLLTRDAARYTQ